MRHLKIKKWKLFLLTNKNINEEIEVLRQEIQVFDSFKEIEIYNFLLALFGCEAWYCNLRWD